MQRPSRIARLPVAVRDDLNQRLTTGAFSGYAELTRWLKRQGLHISSSVVRGCRLTLERRLQAVKLATEQARAVIAASPDDNPPDEALLRLVQQHLFSLLVELDPLDPKRSNLTALARTVAEMGRASLTQKKYADEMRANLRVKLQAAEHTVVEAARIAAVTGTKGGLTPEAEQEIRLALMEIAH
jgi:hypothetical protein